MLAAPSDNLSRVASQRRNPDAEKIHQLGSQFIKIGTQRLTTRRRTQTGYSLFVAPCAPEGTPPVSTRLRPCRTNFSNILPEHSLLVQELQANNIWA